MRALWRGRQALLGQSVRQTLRKDDRGQATVEAAVALPLLFLLLLLLLQPAIVLYDRMVMEGAAAEACRLLATSETSTQINEEFVRRRLSAVPEQDLFHIHEPDCQWRITFAGDAGSDEVAVRIENAIQPLPLVGGLASLLGLTQADGTLPIVVEASGAGSPPWAQGQGDPADNLGGWTR